MKNFLLILSLLSSTSFASTFSIVDKVEGSVKVQHEGSIKKSKVKVGMKLIKGDTILTYRKAKAVLTMFDKTKVVVNEYAKLQLLSEDEFTQSGGKVFFKVTKRQTGKGLKVNTPFAIIGVKGTEFVVSDDNSSKSLALNEGLVGVDSPSGKEFALLDKEKLDNAMGNKPQSDAEGFEAYKRELMAEFTEYKKSFDLSPGKKLNFDGNKVMMSSLNKADGEMFKLFMSDAEFNAISDELEDMSSDIQSEDDLMSDKFFTDE